MLLDKLGDKLGAQLAQQVVRVDQRLVVLAPYRVDHDADARASSAAQARLHLAVHHPLLDVPDVWHDSIDRGTVKKSGDESALRPKGSLQNRGNTV